MITCKIRCPEKDDADNLRQAISLWFGSDDNTVCENILVTSVYTGWYKNKLNHFFDISIEADIEKTIELEGGTIGLEVKDHPVWAIVREDRNDSNQTTEDKKNQ